MSVLSPRVAGEPIDDGRPIVVKSPMGLGMRLLGLPFACIGLGLIAHHLRSGGTGDPMLPVVGVIFALPGLILLLHVSHCLIDPLRGTIETVRGVLVPWWRRSLSFDAVDRICLFSYRAPGNSGSSRIQYAVAAIPAGPKQSEWPEALRGACWIYASGRYPAARKWAERVARVVGKPLEERTDGVRSVRRADELNTPIAEIWRREGPAPTLEPPPADSRLKAEPRDDGLIVELPGGLRGPTLILGVVLAAAISGLAMVAMALAMIELPLLFKLVFAAFAVAPIIVVGVLLAFFLTARTRLELDPDGVTVIRQIGPVPRRTRFEARQLEEVAIPQPSGEKMLIEQLVGGYVVLRGDRQRTTIGAGLSQAELQWLVAAIRWALTHRG